MTATSINQTYLDISLAVYGIQGNTDNTNAIDRNIWEQLPVNIIQGDGTSVFTSNDQNGNPYYICSSGLQAAVYRNKLTNEIVIAYRGTDNEIYDYIADFNIFLNKLPENQINDAVGRVQKGTFAPNML